MALKTKPKQLTLTETALKSLGVKTVKRIDYFDIRYYKVMYETGTGKKKTLMQENLVSVSEILQAYPKDFLERWRGDIGNERADQIVYDSQKSGSLIHYGAQILGDGGTVIYNPISTPIYSEKDILDLEKKTKGNYVVIRYQKEYVQVFRIWQWFQTVKPQKIQSEQTVFSIKHKYAGTLDLFCYIKEGTYSIAGTTELYLPEGWYVCDYKTGKYSSLTQEMQISAYIKAVLESQPKLNIQGGLIIYPNNEKITNGIAGLKTVYLDMDAIETRFKQFLNVYDVYKIEHPTPNPKQFEMPTILKV